MSAATRIPCRSGVRQSSLTRIGLDNYNDSVHGHEFGGLSRVVMVRKTDQRIFQSAKNGEEPKYETVTKETYETFRGNKTERKVTSVAKRDVLDKFPKDLRESISSAKSGSPLRSLGSPTSRFGSSYSRQDTPTRGSPKIDAMKRAADVTSFAADCLAAHNEHRAKHGVPPLKLNKQICKISQRWADTLASRGKITHSQNREYGENIFSVITSDPNYTVNGKDPVNSWYEEIKVHTFGVEPNSLQSGHFTQVIWKESQELGVAFAKGRDGKFVVVANYSPPGNVIGSFARNVPPVGGGGTPQHGFNELDLLFEEECLKAHNEYRKLHGVDPLKLNRRMCKESKEWAKHLASKGQIEHRKHASYGENIYCYWSSNPGHTLTGKEPVENWYNEKSRHHFDQEPTDLRSGHFTQVIWKASRELGVGVEKNRNGQIFVVASYWPAGNYIGSFINNVHPVVGSPESNKLLINGYSIDDNFANLSLKLHNDFRRKHGVPDLKLNYDMCEYAQEWADHLAKDGRLAHRPDCKYGENLFYMWSSDPSATPTAREVCKRWYDELQDFTFGIESRTPRAGHFTQMVWRESCEFGVALAKGKNNGKSFVVANYNPKGNYVGQYTTNVLKPIK